MEAQAQPVIPTRTVTPTGCCPPFDPAPWNEKRITWNEKLFLKDRVRCLFHLPLNINSRMRHNQRLIDAAHAAPEVALMLSDEGSPWRADLYISVTRPVPGAQMATLSGTFLTKVYEGPYRDCGEWAEDMRSYVASKHLEFEKIYFAYTTCPACAKAYGKNYVVLFAKLTPEEAESSPGKGGAL